MQIEAPIDVINSNSSIDIQLIYQQHFFDTQFDIAFTRKWEKAWLLEKYLYPTIIANQTNSKAVYLTTITLLNLKQLEQINLNESLPDRTILSKIFQFITSQYQDFHTFSLEEKQQIYTFLMQVYAQPENEFVQEECYKYLSSALYLSSDKIYLKWHFLRYPNMIPDYIKATKSVAEPQIIKFIPFIVENLIEILKSYPLSEQNYKENEELIQIESQTQFRTFLERNTAPLPTPKHIIQNQNEKLLYRKVTREQMRYLKCIEKFVDLMILFLSSIPTRKYLRIYLLSINLLPYLKCTLPQHHSCVLQTLVQQFEQYLNYPINDHTGELLTYQNQQLIHKDFLKKLQTVLYKKFKFMVQQKELEEFQFIKNLRRSEIEKLFEIMVLVFPLELAPKLYEPGKNFDFLIQEVMKSAAPTPSLRSYLLDKPLIPNEQVIWDYKHIPEESKSGVLKQVLALPKLNLQFLCFEDYLERNYKLFKLESAFDLRKDFEDAITRMDPQFDQKGAFCGFGGWAKMATQVTKFRIHEVQTPEIGKLIPRRVYGEVQFSIENLAQSVRKEWDSLKKHQVVFLVSFRKEINLIQFEQEFKEKLNLIEEIKENEGCKLFCEQYGIRSIRGAEIELIYDERRREILDWEEPDPAKKYQGNLRILHVYLDQAQYYEDIDSGQNAEGEIYGNFSLLVRRNPKENNFKAILSSIQRVILEQPKLPQFLQDLILGYGVKDTSSSYHFMHNSNNNQCQFSLRDTILDEQHFNEVIRDNKLLPEQLRSNVQYLTDNTKRGNKIRFTKCQTTSIVSAMHQGVTLIVGPPGTGKTDVAVQIVNLLYKNFPKQKTLLITHSNHALNDIFEKISKLDIDEKHMLRLGIGVKELKLSKTFSREGRIDHMLTKRIELLGLIQDLQDTCNAKFSEEFSCEVADIFNRKYVQVNKEKFPFNPFIEKHPELFSNCDDNESKYQKIQELFEELKEVRAFELLRNKKERGNYIICHQAKIIAMTCTHAALKRNTFYDYDFQYDNVIFEEAGQILEIEAFLPLTMSTNSSLKRVIMIGDHNQLPPVIKNVSFQKLANMEQSFFIRLLRLGIYHHQLTEQGRTRQEILKLYQWKYKNLGTLPNCLPSDNNQFGYANAGLNKTLQFVDIDYRGSTETRPTLYFYQNVVEAEFVTAVYMYLILIGYSSEQITILTTYNGQKMLIKDIISRKCGWHPLFKSPFKITTVDKYQGQQNDIILLSMVRTEQPGYLRDIRRIIVALSRAKLGLYIFGKYNVFDKVPELQECFKQLKPESLELVPEENYPTKRKGELVDSVVLANHPDQVYEIVRTKLMSRQKD